MDLQSLQALDTLPYRTVQSILKTDRQTLVDLFENGPLLVEEDSASLHDSEATFAHLQSLFGPDRANEISLISFTIEIISPEMAQKYLEKNSRNRPKSKTRVKIWAREMDDGNWTIVPDCIAFDKDNNLLNGQHRLEAVIVSGKPQVFCVLRNCPSDIFTKIDRGASRNQTDVYVTMGGRVEGVPASKITQLARSFLRGINLNYSAPKTDDSIARTASQYQDLFAKIYKIAKDPQGIPYHAGWAAAFAKAILVYNENRITPLLEKFVSANWDKDASDGGIDPLKALYTRIVENSQLVGQKKEKGLQDYNMYRLAVNSIIKSLDGERVKQLKEVSKDFEISFKINKMITAKPVSPEMTAK